MADTITKDYVVERLSDWESRIRVLFESIKQWAGERPEWEVEEGRVHQRHEQLMKEKNVDPKELPTLNLFYKSKRVGFVPSALWIVGADGRINIITNDKLYILVDIRENHIGPSNWRVTTPPKSPETLAFDKIFFLKLLDENK